MDETPSRKFLLYVVLESSYFCFLGDILPYIFSNICFHNLFHVKVNQKLVVMIILIKYWPIPELFIKFMSHVQFKNFVIATCCIKKVATKVFILTLRGRVTNEEVS